MNYEPLDAQAVAEEMAKLDGWELHADGRSITKAFTFRSFREAFAFMTESALAAERLNHHPDWSNSYATVHVALTTHARKQLTDHDIKLAHAMERASRRYV